MTGIRHCYQNLVGGIQSSSRPGHHKTSTHTYTFYSSCPEKARSPDLQASVEDDKKKKNEVGQVVSFFSKLPN